jgi:hypothetical protein
VAAWKGSAHGVPRPEIEVHPTRTFLRMVDALADQLGRDADAVVLQLAAAIEQLEAVA